MADNTKYEDLLNEMVTSTDFELFHFVIGAQDSPHRILRQINLEGNVRQDSLETCERDIKKQKVKIKILKRDIDKEQDELEKELLKIELEELEKGLNNLEKRLKAINYEISVIKNFHEQFQQQLEEGQTKKLMDPDNLYAIETGYWIERLSRQASLDLISTGRLGSGNVESMMNMPPEVAQAALENTFKRSSQFEQTMIPAAKTAGALPQEMNVNRVKLDNYNKDLDS